MNSKSIRNSNSRSPSNSEKDECSFMMESSIIHEMPESKEKKVLDCSLVLSRNLSNQEIQEDNLIKRRQTLININENQGISEKNEIKLQKVKVKKNELGVKLCDNAINLIKKIEYNTYDKRNQLI